MIGNTGNNSCKGAKIAKTDENSIDREISAKAGIERFVSFVV
jgi:hypothetical protein